MARTEIELNKEVLDYKESIFFGLSLRQFVCAGLAVMIAVIVWFTAREILAKEIRSWLCLSLACPFAAAGFWLNLGAISLANAEILPYLPRKKSI